MFHVIVLGQQISVSNPISMKAQTYTKVENFSTYARHAHSANLNAVFDLTLKTYCMSRIWICVNICSRAEVIHKNRWLK